LNHALKPCPSNPSNHHPYCQQSKQAATTITCKQQAKSTQNDQDPGKQQQPQPANSIQKQPKMIKIQASNNNHNLQTASKNNPK